MESCVEYRVSQCWLRFKRMDRHVRWFYLWVYQSLRKFHWLPLGSYWVCWLSMTYSELLSLWLNSEVRSLNDFILRSVKSCIIRLKRSFNQALWLYWKSFPHLAFNFLRISLLHLLLFNLHGLFLSLLPRLLNDLQYRINLFIPASPSLDRWLPYLVLLRDLLQSLLIYLLRYLCGNSIGH